MLNPVPRTPRFPVTDLVGWITELEVALEELERLTSRLAQFPDKVAEADDLRRRIAVVRAALEEVRRDEPRELGPEWIDFTG